MIDPFFEFGAAGADTPEIAADIQAQYELFVQAFQAFGVACQELMRAIVAALQPLMDVIVEFIRQIEPIVTAWRRNILYYRLSERYPRWLARWLTRLWPKRYLPVIT
jgi:hypothetical protein